MQYSLVFGRDEMWWNQHRLNMSTDAPYTIQFQLIKKNKRIETQLLHWFGSV